MIARPVAAVRLRMMARKNAEFFRYEADHGFMNEQRDVHERAAAELAWARTLTEMFLRSEEAAP